MIFYIKSILSIYYNNFPDESRLSKGGFAEFLPDFGFVILLCHKYEQLKVSKRGLWELGNTQILSLFAFSMDFIILLELCI